MWRGNMKRWQRAALVAVASAALIGIPALARAQQGPPATAAFTAVGPRSPSHAWQAGGPSGSSVPVAAGGTVTFAYPSGTSVHNVHFDDASAKPSSCTQTAGMDYGSVPPLPAAVQGPGWAGSCRFDTPGTYTFHCDAHANMTGTIVVQAPTPTP